MESCRKLNLTFTIQSTVGSRNLPETGAIEAQRVSYRADRTTAECSCKCAGCKGVEQRVDSKNVCSIEQVKSFR